MGNLWWWVKIRVMALRPSNLKQLKRIIEEKSDKFQLKNETVFPHINSWIMYIWIGRGWMIQADSYCNDILRDLVKHLNSMI